MEELNRLSEEAFRAAPKTEITILLDNVRSGLNVGSIFRSADAFRISEVICCGITPVPPHREILKTALGATQTVVWNYAAEAASAIRDLRDNGNHIVALEQVHGSTPLHLIKPVYPLVLVIGNEVQGVSEELLPLCHECVEIVQYGSKHSLNAAVAAGIALHHLTVMVAQ